MSIRGYMVQKPVLPSAWNRPADIGAKKADNYVTCLALAEKE